MALGFFMAGGGGIYVASLLVPQEKDMTNLVNPKPRFGYNPDLKTVYDYVDGKDVPITPNYTASDGVWDLTQVRDLILSGSTIESARKSIATPKPNTPPARAQLPAGNVAADPLMKNLAFTPIQAAALGLTPAEMKGGLSAAQAAAIKAKMTPARAIALKLTPNQKQFLGVA